MAFIYNIYHYLWSFVSATIFWFPSRKIKVIGITGTKGKSSTISLLTHVLGKSGYKVASLSSVNVIIGDSVAKNKTGNTMPGRLFIQKFLHDAVKNKCDFALLEVTSQGVVQHRHRFIDYFAAIFLDIHPEHIEAHGSFDNYLSSKIGFFKYASNGKTFFFVNKNDPHANDFISVVQMENLTQFSPNDIDNLKINIPESLQGDFNKINISATLAVCKKIGIGSDKIIKSVESYGGLEGRMDIVVQKPFKIIVDYAHTPDSLEALYLHFFKNKNQSNKLICILGSAGGGRDKWKRPKMGEIASKYCDKIILTDEDPYDENPEEIINQIKSGISEINKIEVVTDRKKALQTAVLDAKEGDIIVSTGKGSESWIHMTNGKKIPWNEKQIFLDIINK